MVEMDEIAESLREMRRKAEQGMTAPEHVANDVCEQLVAMNDALLCRVLGIGDESDKAGK